MHVQTKTIELATADMEDDSNANLPPLMNPTILEASDDLTNLSHLNEPAGMRRDTSSTASGIVLTPS